MYLSILLKLFPIQIVNYFEGKLPNEYFFYEKKKRIEKSKCACMD